MAAVTDHYSLGGLKQQKCIFSQFWRPEAQAPLVCRITLPPKPRGEDPSSPLPGFWWCPAILGAPWLRHTSPSSLTPSPQGLLCVSLSLPSSAYKDARRCVRAHATPVWPHLHASDLQGPRFQIRSPSDIPGGHELGGAGKPLLNRVQKSTDIASGQKVSLKNPQLLFASKYS